jgi:hypothetical protein
VRNVLQLYPRAGPIHDGVAAALYVDPRAMRSIGTTIEQVQQAAGALGFDLQGHSIRLRPEDRNRLADLTGLLDAEVLGRIDT